MTNAEYHNLNSLSSSQLRELEKGLAYYREYLKKPKERKDYFDFGTAFHEIILEPHKFEQNVRIEPICDKRTKEGKEKYNAFLESVGADNYIISESDLQDLKNMKASLLNNLPMFADLSGFEYAIEKPFFFEYRNITCRCRPDLIDFDKKIIYDLKTIDGAKIGALQWLDNDIERVIKSNAYHRQAEFYNIGVSSEYPEIEFTNVLIFIEKTAPYRVIRKTIGYDLLVAARQNIDSIIDNYKAELAKEERGESINFFQFD